MFFFISPIGLGHAARDVAIIHNLKVKNDNNIETLIDLYKKADGLIKSCDKYLDKQKSEIIHVD